MKAITTTVTGTRASHTINIVKPIHYSNCEAMMDEYRKSVNHGKEWMPENGAELKTVGQATGWLKKMLKKNGWPTPTTWNILTFSYDTGPNYRKAITVELVND